MMAHQRRGNGGEMKAALALHQEMREKHGKWHRRNNEMKISGEDGVVAMK
jgi:hypothetical protein